MSDEDCLTIRDTQFKCELCGSMWRENSEAGKAGKRCYNCAHGATTAPVAVPPAEKKLLGVWFKGTK